MGQEFGRALLTGSVSCSGGLRVEPTQLVRSVGKVGSSSEPDIFEDERAAANLELTHPFWFGGNDGGLACLGQRPRPGLILLSPETVVGPALSRSAAGPDG